MENLEECRTVPKGVHKSRFHGSLFFPMRQKTLERGPPLLKSTDNYSPQKKQTI